MNPDPKMRIEFSTDYYPFGQPMPERNFSEEDYRFGFNGKENDNEVYGSEGTFQDYGMRMFDTRLGRFISVDPLTKKYPWYAPYQFAGNMPIWAIDLDGLEELKGPANYVKPVTHESNDPLYITPIKAAGNVAAGYINIGSYAINALDGLANKPIETLNDIGTDLGHVVESMGSGLSQLVTEPFTTIGNIAADPNQLQGVLNSIVGAKVTSVLGGELNSMTRLKVPESPSPKVQNIVDQIEDLKAHGGTIKPNVVKQENILKSQQLINGQITDGQGNYVNLRIETHIVPEKYGGNGASPQKHMNVDYFENGKPKINQVTNNGHKILDE